MMGLPSAVTGPNGTVTAASYDDFYRITETGIADTANLVYTYSKGNPARVAREDNAESTQTYHFAYDSCGNMRKPSDPGRKTESPAKCAAISGQ